jgi:type VI secretion system secreted protein Hcp
VTLPNREVLTVGGSALSLPSVSTSSGPIADVTVTGLKQGPVKTGQKAGSFEVFGFSFGTNTPTGSNSGGASGKRQHSPITIVKEVDSASPLLLQALVTNEALKTIQISFTRPSKTGQETVYERITLTNAFISSVERYHPALTGETAHHNTDELESISFTFQKITVTNLNPK